MIQGEDGAGGFNFMYTVRSDDYNRFNNEFGILCMNHGVMWRWESYDNGPLGGRVIAASSNLDIFFGQIRSWGADIEGYTQNRIGDLHGEDSDA